MNKKILIGSAVIVFGAFGVFGILKFSNINSQVTLESKVAIAEAPQATINTAPQIETSEKNTSPDVVVDVTQESNSIAADLFSAGSINAQMPWEEGDVNATAKALEQAAKVVSVAPQLEFVDSAKKIRIKLPSAWEARPTPASKETTIITSFILEGPGAPPPTCVFTAVKSANTVKVSQAKINEVMHSDKAISGMKKAISSSGAKLISSNKIDIDGNFGLQMTIQPKVSKTAPDLTTNLIVVEQPGVRWQIACSSYSAEYEQIKPEYDEIISSIAWIN